MRFNSPSVSIFFSSSPFFNASHSLFIERQSRIRPSYYSKHARLIHSFSLFFSLSSSPSHTLVRSVQFRLLVGLSVSTVSLTSVYESSNDHNKRQSLVLVCPLTFSRVWACIVLFVCCYSLYFEQSNNSSNNNNKREREFIRKSWNYTINDNVKILLCEIVLIHFFSCRKKTHANFAHQILSLFCIVCECVFHIVNDDICLNIIKSRRN